MKQQNEKWTDRVASALRLAADDLEKFSLQANLGRLEAASLYKNLRRQYNSFSKRVLNRLKQFRTVSADKISEIQEKIKSFNERTKSDDSAESSSSFASALLQLKKQISGMDLPKEYKDEIAMELEKFNIKLKILRLRMEGKKVDAKQKMLQRRVLWRKRLTNFRNRIERIRQADSRKNIERSLSQQWKKLKRLFV